MRILIVCNAGRNIGFGHLSRSLVIAKELRDYLQVNVEIIVSGDEINHPELNLFEHTFLSLDKDLIETIFKKIQAKQPNIIIFDLSPQFTPSSLDRLLIYLKMCKIKIIGVDSIVEFGAYLDLLFIPSILFEKSDKIPVSTPIMMGWDCFLLKSDIEPSPWYPGNKVLILTGGSDVAGIGNTLPAKLDRALPEGSEIHWVIGPYAQLPHLPESPRLNIIIHNAPPNLNKLMTEVNYALTVFGVSFFELLYYGIPTVVFSPYGSRDDAYLKKIKHENVAMIAKDEDDAILKLNELMNSNSLAMSLSNHARQKLAVNGTKKFISAIKMLVDSENNNSGKNK